MQALELSSAAFQSALLGNWKWKQSWGLNPDNKIQNANVTNGISTIVPNACPDWFEELQSQTDYLHELQKYPYNVSITNIMVGLGNKHLKRT